ncbi:hypothetical protein JHK85_038470 [Glycine max]|nr:hypothetical protein JHK85_038470 [Glycine max]
MPTVKYKDFTISKQQQSDISMGLFSFCRWSAIAARLPGRTDNEIKNYWNTHVRKRLLRTGIDPVTHAPRLDLLDISSILRSAIGNVNPSILNLQGLLGAQALMNPEFLKLAATATLLSLKNNENPSNLVSQVQQQFNSAGNCLVQNQVAAPNDPFQTPTHVNNGLSSSSPENSILSHLGENNNYQLNAQQINQVDLLLDHELEHYLNCVNQNIGYESVTPLSTPTPLNSSSTYVNSSTEEERDTYCSDIFKLEIPESLDISDFL